MVLGQENTGASVIETALSMSQVLHSSDVCTLAPKGLREALWSPPFYR